MTNSLSLNQQIFFGPCACGMLRAAARSISQLYDLVLAPTGLKATQFIILKTIYEKGDIAQCDFSRSQSVAVETLSRRLSVLRRKGYIQSRTGRRHGERIYSLTEAGIQAFVSALPYWERAQRRLRTALGDVEWNRMLELSERIRKAARSAETLRTDNQLRPDLLPVDGGVSNHLLD